MRSDKRDANEAEIVEFWRRLGGVWVKQSRDAGFDGVLGLDGKVYLVEIKNPDYTWDYTPAEVKRYTEFSATLVPIYTIETLQDAAEMVGRRLEEV